MSARRIYVDREITFEGTCEGFLSERGPVYARALGLESALPGATGPARRAELLLALALAEHVSLGTCHQVREWNWNPTLSPCSPGQSCTRYWFEAAYSSAEEWALDTVRRIRAKRTVRLLWDQGRWEFARALALSSPFRRATRREIVSRFLTALQIVAQRGTTAYGPLGP